MTAQAPRLLLALSSLLLAAGGIFHATSFERTFAVIAASGLPSFLGNGCKTLWAADSSTLLILAAVFGLIAAQPSAATRPIVLLLALMPAALAILLYIFIGSFYGGHMLLAAAAAAFFAGLTLPGTRVQLEPQSK
jgi:hypothetical protein